MLAIGILPGCRRRTTNALAIADPRRRPLRTLTAQLGFSTKHATAAVIQKRLVSLSCMAVTTVRSRPLRSTSTTVRGGYFDEDDRLLVSSTASTLQNAYESRGTDGVVEAILGCNVLSKLVRHGEDHAAYVLIEAARQAAPERDRSALASTLNAILAACCGDEDGKGGFPGISFNMLLTIDELCRDDEAMVAPDIVTLSLVYHCLHKSSGEFGSHCRSILERAQKLAKKKAGSQRRKQLAAERRRKVMDQDLLQIQSRLRELCGPDITVLENTEDLIVVSKPSGVVCYHTKMTTAGKITKKRKQKARSNQPDFTGQADISLVDALLDVTSLSTINPLARGIVHRIDRGTSGALVLAKTDECHLELVALFFLRRVKKKYFALVHGDDMLEQEGTIDSDIEGKHAVSRYRVMKIHEDAGKPFAVQLEVETLTGRKHQVRIHCAHGLGRPIILDPLYGQDGSQQLSDRISKLEKELNGMREMFFLHAAQISIPEFGITAKAPLPSSWCEVLDQQESSCNH